MQKSAEEHYRVWDPKAKRFLSVNVDNFRLTYQGDLWIASETNGGSLEKRVETSVFMEPASPFLQRATGLRDKKNKPTFEGDIIRFEYWVGDFAWECMDEEEAKWQEAQIGKVQIGTIAKSLITSNLEFHVPQDVGLAIYDIMYASGRSAEVIGHIFDGKNHNAVPNRSEVINTVIAKACGWERMHTGYGEIWKDNDGKTQPPEYTGNFDAVRSAISTIPAVQKSLFLLQMEKRYGQGWSLTAPAFNCAAILCQVLSSPT